MIIRSRIHISQTSKATYTSVGRPETHTPLPVIRHQMLFSRSNVHACTSLGHLGMCASLLWSSYTPLSVVGTHIHIFRSDNATYKPLGHPRVDAPLKVTQSHVHFYRPCKISYSAKPYTTLSIVRPHITLTRSSGPTLTSLYHPVSHIDGEIFNTRSSNFYHKKYHAAKKDT